MQALTFETRLEYVRRVITSAVSPKTKPPITAGKMHDPSFCHYCNVNKLDPKDKYYLPNGIEVCQECAERLGATAKRQARPKRR